MRAISRTIWTAYGFLRKLKFSSVSLMTALGRVCQVNVKLKELTDMYQK